MVLSPPTNSRLDALPPPSLRHVKAICEKHGVPYVQENIIARMTKVPRMEDEEAMTRCVWVNNTDVPGEMDEL